MANKGEKIGRLRDFFKDSFKESDVAMFLTVNGYEEVALAVNRSLGGIEYFFEVTQELDRRGLIDHAFFVRLREERPKKEALIRGLQEFWLLEEEPGPESSGSTTASGPRELIHPEPPSLQDQSSVTPPSAGISCPYPGLRPFTEAEEAYFFGRKEHVSTLLDRLTAHRLLAVAGASGSGKTSLIQAGLIPALKAGELGEGKAPWRIERVRPGDQPLRQVASNPLFLDLYRSRSGSGSNPVEEDIEFLRGELNRDEEFFVELLDDSTLADEKKCLLLVVDQFEEIFYRPDGTNAEEARAFIKLLSGVTRRPGRVPLYVALVLRSEFLGMCGAFPQLPALINQGLYLVPELSDKQYEDVIMGPLAAQSGGAEPELVARLLDDVRHRPDALPLLQHALSLLWYRWSAQGAQSEGRIAPPFLTLEHYREIGGLPQAPHTSTPLGLLGCVEDNLKRCIEMFDDEQKRIAKALFLALGELHTFRFVTQRRIRLGKIAETCEASLDGVMSVVTAFSGPGRDFFVRRAGQVPSFDDTLEVSHDSLFRLWTRYKEWFPDPKDDAEMRLFDVFMCYSTSDQMEVLDVGGKLKAAAIRVWMDIEQIAPGQSFQTLINEKIVGIRTAAVFFGKGLGRWQSEEMEALKSQAVGRKLPVIPVILKSCTWDGDQVVPPMLGTVRRVDFRTDRDPLGMLIWGITGRRPETPAPRDPGITNAPVDQGVIA